MSVKVLALAVYQWQPDGKSTSEFDIQKQVQVLGASSAWYNFFNLFQYDFAPIERDYLPALRNDQGARVQCDKVGTDYVYAQFQELTNSVLILVTKQALKDEEPIHLMRNAWFAYRHKNHENLKLKNMLADVVNNPLNYIGAYKGTERIRKDIGIAKNIMRASILNLGGNMANVEDLEKKATVVLEASKGFNDGAIKQNSWCGGGC